MELGAEQSVQETQTSSTTQDVNQSQEIHKSSDTDVKGEVVNDSGNADDLNAPKIPRSRLNEEIAKKKELETQLNQLKQEYEATKGKYSKYETWEQVASTNPVFATEIDKVIEAYNSGKLTATQAKEAIDDINEQDGISKKDIESSVVSAKQEVVFDMYFDKFDQIVRADYDNDEDIAYIGELTQKELLKNNPNAFNRYSSAELAKAYKSAKERIDNMVKRSMGKYVEQKKQDATPSITPSSSAIKEPDFANMSQQDLSKWLAESLKQR